MTDQPLELAEAALDLDGADAVEALVLHQTSGLTRYAANRIHQSTWREDVEVRVRVVVGAKRVGVASTHDASPAGVAGASRRARAVAHAMPPDRAFPGLPGKATYTTVGRYDDATAAADPATRAGLVAEVIGRMPAGVTAAGACETGSLEVAIANSNGVRAASAGTFARFSVLADAGPGTGYAEAVEPALADLPALALGERAGDKAVASREPRDLAPGAYPVVLEPNAVATLVEFLGYLGFSARAYREGRSCLVGRLGQRIASPMVTIVDDGLAPDTLAAPFDFEGVPRRRVTLVDEGVATGLVYDLREARLAGVEPTGHGLPAPSPLGALPLHLSVLPGRTTQADLVAQLGRGLLVTRFHYTNVVNPMATILTGMTRDGTFWVEDGKVTGAVRNLRFTQSILGALAAVREVGAETELTGGHFALSATRTPALAIDRFSFSSATTF